jgi:hypothetical protein
MARDQPVDVAGPPMKRAWGSAEVRPKRYGLLHQAAQVRERGSRLLAWPARAIPRKQCAHGDERAARVLANHPGLMVRTSQSPRRACRRCSPQPGTCPPTGLQPPDNPLPLMLADDLVRATDRPEARYSAWTLLLQVAGWCCSTTATARPNALRADQPLHSAGWPSIWSGVDEGAAA